MSQRDSDPGTPFSHIQQAIHKSLPTPSRVDLPIFAERDDRLLGVLGAMKAWVAEFDSTGRMIYASPQMETALGITPGEALDPGSIAFHPDDLPAVLELSRCVRETGQIGTNQTRMRHSLGHWLWVETSLVPWLPSKDGGFHTIAFARDITELKTAEAARSESEARYRVVSEMSCDLITEVDATGRQTYAGPGSDEILGYSGDELLTLEPFALVHPEDRPRIRAQFDAEFRRETERDPSHFESSLRPMQYRIQHRDGRWLWFETLGLTYPRADGETRYLSVTRNVTEQRHAEQARRELEHSMQRAQKLESLGVLAGGIAHDFNNLLTPILGQSALAVEDLPADSPVRARLRKIQEAATRAAALTNQMLAYAGQQTLRAEPMDLSKLVGEMRELVESSISGHTTLDLLLDPDLPAVEAEAAQLSQVVLNLITNAAESLGDGVGRIGVRTGTTEIEAPPPNALFAETMKPGRHVFFEVRDDGCGMAPDTCSKIFDPFFTTKFTGRGLGLAAVAGIVRSHRGAIEVESQPGEGTRFRIWLPAIEGAARTESPPPPMAPWRTEGTALVIDDDASIRELAADILRRAGMNVLTAADGHEGAKLFEIHQDAIRLVLLDRTMPTASGSDTFRRIRELRPDAQVLLVSGYSEERATADLDLGGLAGFLMKPFEPDTLLERVREVLERPPISD